MGNPTALDADTVTRLRLYAQRLGVTDDRAVAAALGRCDGRSGQGLEAAFGLLRSWQRHPASRPHPG